MIKADVFVENARTPDVINAASLILAMMDLSDDTIVEIGSKAGGVEMVVKFDKMLDYELFLYDLEDIIGTSVTTFMY